MAKKQVEKKPEDGILKDLKKGNGSKESRRKELKKLIVYSTIMEPKYEEGLK